MYTVLPRWAGGVEGGLRRVVRPDPHQAGGRRVQEVLRRVHPRAGGDTCQPDGP